jgi:CheY-like chemotaxis protein
MQKSRDGPDSLVVLVVEDEFLLRLEIVDYLRNAGCVVLEAWSTNEAVAMCRNGEPVVRALQPGAGVIYVSGNSLDHSRRVVDSLFFKKPYSAQEILEACRGLA